MRNKKVDADIDAFEFIERLYAAMNISHMNKDTIEWDRNYNWTTFQKDEKRYDGKDLIEALQLLETYTITFKKLGELLDISKVQS